MRDVIKNRGMFNEVLREQWRLQKATAVMWERDALGRMTADMIIPKGAPRLIDQTRQKIGLYATAAQAAAENTVKWGKNTQWAGRQLSMGFTYPIIALGAATGAAAYQIDQSLTRITKVYGDMGQATSGQLKKVREDSLETAKYVAENYGMAGKETLEVAADLAAAGRQGAELQQTTRETMRFAALGEIEHQQAMKTSIALQSTFNMSSQQLADTIDYMNSVESGTVLSMQDLAEAIPRAAGPIKAVGGNVKDLAVLLVAMKERGIDAAQGANAIKSSFQRILRPSKQVSAEFQQLTGKDINALVESTNGELIPTFQKIGEAVEGLNRVQRARALAGLFGTYQYSRLSALLDGIIDKEGQVGNVLRINAESQSQYTAQAAREIKRQQESASNTFKRTLESIKIEAAEFGEPFLKIGTQIAGVVLQIMKAFGGLDDTTKRVLAWSAILVGIVGPLVMIAGLFANLIGTTAKFFASMVKRATGFQLITAEQKANELAANQTAVAYQSEAAAVADLSKQYEKLLADLRAVTGEQIRAKAAMGGYQSVPMAGGSNAVWTGRGYRDDKSGKFVNSALVAEQAAQNHAQQEAIKQQHDMGVITEENTAKQRKLGGVIRANGMALGTSVGILGMMAAGTDSVIGKMSELLLTVSLIGPAIAPVARWLKAWTIGRFTKELLLGKILLGSMAGGVRTLAIAIRGLAGPIGLVVAGLMAWKMWHDRQHEAYMRNLHDELNGTATMARALGISLDKVQKVRQDGTQQTEAEASATEKWAKNNEELVKTLDKLNNTQLRNRAIQMGVQAMERGATAEEAKRVAQGVIDALGRNMAISLDFDFTDTDEVAKKEAERFSQAWQRYMNETGFVPYANQDASHAVAERMAKDLATIISNGTNAAASQAVEAAAKGLRDRRQELLDSLDLAGGQMKAMRQAGYRGNTNEAAAAFLQTDDAMNVVLNSSQQQIIRNLQALEIGQRNYVVQVAKSLGFSKEQIKSFRTLKDVLRAAGKEVVPVAQAEIEYGQAVTNAINANHGITAAQQEAIRQYYLARGGLDAASEAGKNFGATTYQIAAAANTAAAAVRGLSGDTEALKNMTQTAMSGWQDAVLGEAQRRLEVFNEGVLQNIDDAGSRAADRIDANARKMQRRFEQRAEAIKNTYDTRKQAIKDQIDAEEDADKRREQLFNKEKQRLERMAELESGGIDFNAALASGEVDQAAKILITNGAKIAGWAMDDSNEAAGAASDARKQALHDRMDGLDDEQKAAEDVLEKEKDRYSRRVDAAKKANERETANRRKAAEEQQRIAQVALDNELSAIKAFVPRTAAERADQLRKIEAAYDTYGGKLQLKGDQWSKFVGDALKANTMAAAASLSNDQRWAQFGQAAGDALVNGAFNMSMKQFFNWIKTGSLPKNYKAPAAPKNSVPAGNPMRNKIGTLPISHGGSIVGRGDKSNRGGRSKSAGMFGDEQLILAQKGEGILSRKAVNTLGTDTVDDLNKGRGGFAQGIAGGFAALMQMAMARAFINAQAAMMPSQFGLESGIFAGTSITDEMARNAGTIMSVGKSMGATQRDLIIALMTAMQESGLKNLDYGDRDSLGLFQQRPSQGWGTPAQIRNPEYAARQFFKRLLANKDRNDMSLTLAAQSVQRSAFPYAYAQWEDLARAMVNGATQNVTPGQMLNSVTGIRGWQSPVRPVGINVPYSQHQKPGQGDDLRAVVGQPVFAANAGVVRTSKDLVGPGGKEGYYSYGRYIVIDHGDGLATLYAHLSERLAQVGQQVPAGSRIGLAGQTGHASGPHLHFELLKNGVDINPGSLIPGLRKGGITLNSGLANLHPQEAVLTKPLTSKFEKGVDNFASGAGNTYNVNVALHGTDLSADDVARAVEGRLRMKEKAVGRSRRVG
jgi:TP901 family phage tail tape measure protein